MYDPEEKDDAEETYDPGEMILDENCQWDLPYNDSRERAHPNE